MGFVVVFGEKAFTRDDILAVQRWFAPLSSKMLMVHWSQVDRAV
jgi:hypothetical protein